MLEEESRKKLIMATKEINDLKKREASFQVRFLPTYFFCFLGDSSNICSAYWPFYALSHALELTLIICNIPPELYDQFFCLHPNKKSCIFKVRCEIMLMLFFTVFLAVLFNLF